MCGCLYHTHRGRRRGGRGERGREKEKESQLWRHIPRTLAQLLGRGRRIRTQRLACLCYTVRQSQSQNKLITKVEPSHSVLSGTCVWTLLQGSESTEEEGQKNVRTSLWEGAPGGRTERGCLLTRLLCSRTHSSCGYLHETYTRSSPSVY